jgi:hypothetical protein
MAAIDAFFSWTEHIFIHIAILNSSITTGEDFAALSGAEWNVKFKRADSNNERPFRWAYRNPAPA